MLLLLLQIAGLLQRRSLFEKETKVFFSRISKFSSNFPAKRQENSDDSRFLVKKPRNSREENLRLLFKKRRSFISVAKEQQFVVWIHFFGPAFKKTKFQNKNTQTSDHEKTKKAKIQIFFTVL